MRIEYDRNVETQEVMHAFYWLFKTLVMIRPLILGGLTSGVLLYAGAVNTEAHRAILNN